MNRNKTVLQSQNEASVAAMKVAVAAMKNQKCEMIYGKSNPRRIEGTRLDFKQVSHESCLPGLVEFKLLIWGTDKLKRVPQQRQERSTCSFYDSGCRMTLALKS